MSAAKTVTAFNFQDEVVASATPVIVDFYADWCGPCRMLGPVLDKVATTYEGKVKVVKVNVDQDPELAMQYRVSSIPKLVFIHQGQVVGQTEGVLTERQLAGVADQMVAL
jgi:thioredoxin 1